MTSPAAPFKGQPVPEQVVLVERSAIANFADGITDDNSVFRDPTVAAEQGFEAIPSPPTFNFVMAHWGAFDDLQPDDQPPAPLGGAIAAMMATGGMILHGEQEFTYHRPVVVGDRLRSTGEMEDVYVKASGERTMTFLVQRTDWVDAESGDPVVTSRMTIIHRG